MKSSSPAACLDYYQRLVQNVIMVHQSPVTGLFPANPDNNHSWIRDNVYCILSVWGLSMASEMIAEVDRAKVHELKQSCVKLMRGLLVSMMHQKDKVEKFKRTQNPCDSLHAKFSSSTGEAVVKDDEWGHLQIDAVSLYLLVLAQMTASGLQVIFNLDEVAFVQNLVFYIEAAYCIPDYGVWERGDKTNHGLPELNASSVGMAKAALESLNELDLFGSGGGFYSVIHVLEDEMQKCHTVLQSMLPRESNSKEIDSGLLAIISYPAFAVTDINLIQTTKDAIISKLQGCYGCKRFLRDGHKTPLEDPNRLYYEPWELRMFENIECEWPLFFCYFILDAYFWENRELALEYTEKLEKILISSEDGIKLVPELYSVRSDDVAAECSKPGSQSRIPVGRCPFLWAQSLYILGKLLEDNFLTVAHLDPLNRRLCSAKKPDVVIQVVVLAEDSSIRDKLLQYDIHVQTVEEVSPIEVLPARVLGNLYTHLGKCKNLGLSGRTSRDVGILSTSKLYALNEKIIAFTPQKIDLTHFYIASDCELMIDIFKSEISFLKSRWKNSLGRPLVIINLKNIHLDQGKIPMVMVTTIKKLKSGYINGTRVTFGNLSDFLTTSNITNLSFLERRDEEFPNRLDPEIEKYWEEHLGKKTNKPLSKLTSKEDKFMKRRMSIRGAIKKTRSITIELDSISKQTEECLVIRRPSLQVRAECHNETSKTDISTVTSSSSKENGTTNSKLGQECEQQSVTREILCTDAEVQEVLAMLRETDNLEEEGDILQYLVNKKGLQCCTGASDGKVTTVKDLLKNLYVKACEQKLWGLVRHAAGILGKRYEDLAKSITDLVVRQKQVTIGMPPNDEHTITGAIPDIELRHLIHQAYGDDRSSSMLTQELIIYLAMFIRSDPQLFKEMLRIRVGLIIQVMATELCRSLGCSGDEASEHLLNLSPFEMKSLLHHILSGKEFALTSVGQGNYSITSCKSSRISKKSQIGLVLSEVCDERNLEKGVADRQGQWLRRRRLDGALNRVPINFYPGVWFVLEKCQGLAIEGRLLPQNLTQEMTSGELKFALAVETALNSIPQPEYRQLMVEALMVLTLIAEHSTVTSLGGIIPVEQLIHKGNALFLEDQIKVRGDATLCCAKQEGEQKSKGLICGGAAYICQHFYDSAPSGSYGTMTYITKAVSILIKTLPHEQMMDCSIY
ncbi:hypothetical protein RUM44_012863 [Polyplax serrata]|uniref:Phosphorylase b kinase regulatory subunit n=1 Tax=Polyplax serrata TaxID=468196 RepID=A0ABR1BGI1_POLSC